MAVEYTLTVNGLQTLPEYQGQSDVVWAVDWTYTGTDGVFTMNVTGTTPVDLNLGCDVTSFAALTETTVTSWIMRDTNPDVWVAARQQITEWLEGQYSQVATTLPPPWVQ